MKDKLQEYALMAEIISAICIVLSLVFVGLQVRQGAEETAVNSVAVRGSVQQAMMQTDIQIVTQAYGSPNIVDGLDIPDDELDEAFIFFVSMARSRENYWNQYKNGLLDEANYQAYTNVFVNMLARSEFYNDNWQRISNNGNFVQGFIDDTNDLLEAKRL